MTCVAELHCSVTRMVYSILSRIGSAKNAVCNFNDKSSVDAVLPEQQPTFWGVQPRPVLGKTNAGILACIAICSLADPRCEPARGWGGGRGGVPMSLRIEEGIRGTEPCSSATQLISEDSDLYLPFK